MNAVSARTAPEPGEERDAEAAVQLLLCAHAERRWLSSQIEPLLDELEGDGEVRPQDRGAALACLQALWSAELSLAAQTEAAYLRLPEAAGADGARSSHEGVRSLRGEAGRRADLLLRSWTVN